MNNEQHESIIQTDSHSDKKLVQLVTQVALKIHKAQYEYSKAQRLDTRTAKLQNRELRELREQSSLADNKNIWTIVEKSLNWWYYER